LVDANILIYADLSSLEQRPPSSVVRIRSPRKISRPRFRVQRFSSYSLQRVLDAVSSAGLSARLVLRKQQWYNAMGLHVEM
jgi:hypothetical protein